MIIKTRASFAQRVSTRRQGDALLFNAGDMVIPVESVDQGYLDWLLAETEHVDVGWVGPS